MWSSGDCTLVNVFERNTTFVFLLTIGHVKKTDEIGGDVYVTECWNSNHLLESTN